MYQFSDPTALFGAKPKLPDPGRTAAQERAAEERAAAEARRRAQEEAQRRQGRARSLLTPGGNVAELTTRRTLLGAG